jgi:hypothetical protein
MLDLAFILDRHGRTWSDHPRVSIGQALLRQANSWMVVPSTRLSGTKNVGNLIPRFGLD